MHAVQLLEILVVGASALGLGWFVMSSLARAEHGFASLFVPPDRQLGWPRGVQESDEPWGWHPPATPTEVFASPDLPPIETERSTPADWMVYRAGSFVIPVRPVAPIRFELRPH